MFYHYIIGLSAILDIGVLNLLKNPVWILFRLYLYLCLNSQVKKYYIQVGKGKAANSRDVFSPKYNTMPFLSLSFTQVIGTKRP